MYVVYISPVVTNAGYGPQGKIEKKLKKVLTARPFRRIIISMNKETQMKGLVRIGYTVAALTVGLTVWLGYVNFLAIMNGVL